MLSCFIDGGHAFSVEEITASGGSYDVGDYSSDRAILVAQTYSIGDGTGSLSALNFAGTGTTIKAKLEQANGDGTQKGAAIGLYTGTATSGSVTSSSTTGSGFTHLVKVYKILNYNDIYDAKTSGTLGTVNGKAAVMAVPNSTITLTNPTDGSGILVNGAAVSLA